MLDLPSGHFWVHKGGLYFYCKTCECRVVKELQSSKTGFSNVLRLVIPIENDKYFVSNHKIPDTCEEYNMNKALE